MAERERNGRPLLGRQRSVHGGRKGIPPARSGSGSRSGSANSLKKSQNYAAKAAAARLAQVMQQNRDSIDDDDMPRYSPYTRSARDATQDQSSGFRGRSDSIPATLGSTLRPTRPLAASSQPVAQRPRPEPFADCHCRFSSDLPTSGPSSRRETAALRDEIDMLQEENEMLLDKLRIVEEKLAERDSRSRELEKQVIALGDGIMNSEEQLLKQRESALKDFEDDELAALHVEAEAEAADWWWVGCFPYKWYVCF